MVEFLFEFVVEFFSDLIHKRNIDLMIYKTINFYLWSNSRIYFLFFTIFYQGFIYNRIYFEF